jgi:putative transport protein
MIVWLVEAIRHHAEIAFFLTLGIGYLLGKLTLGGFSLGAVTGTLLAGVLVGQIGVTVSPDVKQCFFVLFLFSIGYRCGPQFFRGLRKDGLAQAGVATIVATTGLIVAFVVSRLLGYDGGTGAGVIAGALTESATIGTAGDAIAHLPISPDQRTMMANHIPVAFAVTYLIGVVGVAWFLAQLAPRIIKVDLAKACHELEEQLGGSSGARALGVVSAYRNFDVRAYHIPDSAELTGRPVSQILPGLRVFVERVRRGAQIIDADGNTILQPGDIAAISGRRDRLVNKVDPLLAEVEDLELLDMPAQQLDVYVTSKALDGKTLEQLVVELSDSELAYGVYLRRIVRNMVDLPLLPETQIRRGDVVTITGTTRHVDKAAAAIGVADRPTETTDMVFVATGIVLGALVGLPSLGIGSLELGLSLSVGVLLGGLVCGWLRSRWPIVSRLPGPTLWIFESIGLTGFVAVVGLAAGPDFVRGLQTSGLSLVLAGVLTALIPHLTGVLIGHHVFKMHPGILLGVCAGAGTATPALAAIQEAAKSSVPTLGYGVSYAVGNVLLALWGTVIVALLG